MNDEATGGLSETGKKGNKMLEREDAQWLVARRSEIQQFLLELYEYRDVVRKSMPDEVPDVERESMPDEVRAFVWLVGAAFSLWRAVFLTVNERDWPAVLQAAEEFLSKVMEDNAITFTQDKAFNDWTFGYYLNNAYFRVASTLYLLLGVHHESEVAIGKTTHAGTVEDLALDQVKLRFSKKSQPTIEALWESCSVPRMSRSGAPADAKALEKMLLQRNKGIVGLPSKEAWEIGYEATLAAFRLLQSFCPEKNRVPSKSSVSAR